MKNKMTWMRTFALFALIGLTFVSCRMDDDNFTELLPVEVSDVPGVYNGKAVAKQGQFNKTYLAEFTASADAIAIKEFPMDEIVRSILSDPIKVKAALEQLEPIPYTMGYTGELASSKKEVILKLGAQALQFDLPVDGQTKSVVVHFKEEAAGSYYATEMGAELYLAFNADKIEVDGEELASTEEISYLFGGLKK